MSASGCCCPWSGWPCSSPSRAWHFGRGDALAHGPDNLLLRGAAHGGLIFLIPTAHWPETLRLFDLLTGGVPAALHMVFLTVTAAWLLLLAGLLAAGIVSRKAVLEIAALGLMVWLLPPLPAFAVYFVGVHSARHFRRLAVQAGMQRPQDWGLSAGLAALSIVVIAAAAVMLDGLAVSDALAKTVFIALAGLTVPHMLLVDGLQLLTKTEEARRHAA